MKIKLCITQEDIDQGIKCSCGACPVALASCRRFKLPRYSVEVYLGKIWVANTRIELPENLIDFYCDFDARVRSKIKPTSGIITVIPEQMKAINILRINSL